jgi:hypothetical protein
MRKLQARKQFSNACKVSSNKFNSRQEYNKQKTRAEEKLDEIASRLEIFQRKYLFRLAQQKGVLTNHISSRLLWRFGSFSGHGLPDHQLYLVPIKLFRVSYISRLIFLNTYSDVNFPSLSLPKRRNFCCIGTAH